MNKSAKPIVIGTPVIHAGDPAVIALWTGKKECFEHFSAVREKNRVVQAQRRKSFGKRGVKQDD